ncbi:MAG: peptidyl-tRNA hydrolase, partial [Candidatus Diapherotrites archaeon]
GSLEELLAIYNSAKNVLPCALVKDAGKTQVSSGSITCVGIGPAPDFEIDKFTRGLKLL